MERKTFSKAPKAPKGVTRERVKILYLAGASVRAIAVDLEVSPTAVYSHLAALRKAGELPQAEERAS